jgi:hypothetical protein
MTCNNDITAWPYGTITYIHNIARNDLAGKGIMGEKVIGKRIEIRLVRVLSTAI